jgi:hypothetical protein
MVYLQSYLQKFLLNLCPGEIMTPDAPSLITFTAHKVRWVNAASIYGNKVYRKEPTQERVALWHDRSAPEGAWRSVLFFSDSLCQKQFISLLGKREKHAEATSTLEQSALLEILKELIARYGEKTLNSISSQFSRLVNMPRSKITFNARVAN